MKTRDLIRAANVQLDRVARSKAGGVHLIVPPSEWEATLAEAEALRKEGELFEGFKSMYAQTKHTSDADAVVACLADSESDGEDVCPDIAGGGAVSAASVAAAPAAFSSSAADQAASSSAAPVTPLVAEPAAVEQPAPVVDRKSQISKLMALRLIYGRGPS